jgi:hypothetical protein
VDFTEWSYFCGKILCMSKNKDFMVGLGNQKNKVACWMNLNKCCKV